MINIRTLGVFNRGSSAAAAIKFLRDDGFENVNEYGPVLHHDIALAQKRPVSPVRIFTLVGAVFGCIVGFAFPIYTVYDWPLITGGMPLISIPAFVVIAFELTILFGAIGGMVGFLILARLPSIGRQSVGDPAFSNDTFGVAVVCQKEQVSIVRSHFERAHAVKVYNDA